MTKGAHDPTPPLPPWGHDATSWWTVKYGRPPILPPGYSYASRPPRSLRQKLALAALALVAAVAGGYLNLNLLLFVVVLPFFKVVGGILGA